MPIERSSAGASLLDVLDRVLDRGVVLEQCVRSSLEGVDLLTSELRLDVSRSLPGHEDPAEGGTPEPARSQGA